MSTTSKVTTSKNDGAFYLSTSYFSAKTFFSQNDNFYSYYSQKYSMQQSTQVRPRHCREYFKSNTHQTALSTHFYSL
jgi:hypothetical protein